MHINYSLLDTSENVQGETLKEICALESNSMVDTIHPLQKIELTKPRTAHDDIAQSILEVPDSMAITFNRDRIWLQETGAIRGLCLLTVKAHGKFENTLFVTKHSTELRHGINLMAAFLGINTREPVHRIFWIATYEGPFSAWQRLVLSTDSTLH